MRDSRGVFQAKAEAFIRHACARGQQGRLRKGDAVPGRCGICGFDVHGGGHCRIGHGDCNPGGGAEIPQGADQVCRGDAGLQGFVIADVAGVVVKQGGDAQVGNGVALDVRHVPDGCAQPAQVRGDEKIAMLPACGGSLQVGRVLDGFHVDGKGIAGDIAIRICNGKQDVLCQQNAVEVHQDSTVVIAGLVEGDRIAVPGAALDVIVLRPVAVCVGFPMDAEGEIEHPAVKIRALRIHPGPGDGDSLVKNSVVLAGVHHQLCGDVAV